MSDSSSPLHIPPDMVYDCVQCGRGCTAFWEIPVDRESEERIKKLDLETLLPSEDRRPPLEDSEFVPGRRILRQVRSHCCFLTFQKKCAIHQRYGKEIKPQACQDFPFRYIATPVGDFVGLTFACTAVLEEKGPPVSAHQEWLEQNRTRTVSRRTIRLPVHLAERIPITWKQYEAIEADLQEILTVETQPVESRLIAQNLYLRLLEEFVRKANAEGFVSAPSPTPPQSTATDPAPASAAASLAPPEPPAPPSVSLEGVLPPIPMTDEILDTFHNQMRRDSWTRLFSMAFKRIEQPLLLRWFLGQVIAFRQALGKKRRGRIGTVALIIGSYIRHAFRTGALFLEPLPQPIDWPKLRKVGIDFTEPYTAYTVRRFFSHSLFRKDLLLEDNLRLAHGFLLMYFGLWRYYIAALAALEGLEIPERRHLNEGLFNIEKYYVFHSSFNTLFTQHPRWRAAVESIMNNPAFPATMTRAPL